MRSRPLEAPDVAERFEGHRHARNLYYGNLTLAGMVMALGGTALSVGMAAASQVEGLSGSPAAMWLVGGACAGSALRGVNQMARGTHFSAYLEREPELIKTALGTMPPLSSEGIQRGIEHIQNEADVLDKRRLADARRIHNNNIDLPGDDGVRHVLLDRLLRYGHPHSGGEVFNSPAACVIGWTGVARPGQVLGKRDKVAEVLERKVGSPVTPEQIHEHFAGVLDELVPLDDNMGWGEYYASDKYREFAWAVREVASSRRAMRGLWRRRSWCLGPFERG